MGKKRRSPPVQGPLQKAATKKFGRFLKAAREAASMSQREVSERLGYTTPQFVSNWERGIIQPPIETMKGLSFLYGIKAGDVKRGYFEILEAEWLDRRAVRLEGV